MDCRVPVDDFCDVWQANNLKIPEKIPATDNNLDQFFMVFDVETTVPSLHDDDDVEEYADQFVQVEDTNVVTFWAPCPRIEQGNLTRDDISGMLSRAGVPLHKHEFMVDRISTRADEIANAVRNNGKRVLPMMVEISIIACFCYGESIEDN